MFIRIRLASKPAEEETVRQWGGYPLRPTSLLVSVGIHCVGIVLLGLLSSSTKVSQRPLYEELIQPQAHKIVFYDFRKKPRDVEPLKKSGDSPQPRGAELSKQAVIATSPNAISTQQTIWLPVPKIEIRQDVQAPNLIARMNTSLPSLPAPPKEKPRPEVEVPKAVQAPESSNDTVKPPKQAKAFVPPPPSVREPKLPLPTVVSEMPVPAFDSPAVSSRLPVGAGTPMLLQGAAPPPNAPVAPVANSGNASVDIAVASLHPAENTSNKVPEGERPGRFSKAPETGPPSSGDVGKSGLTVPNLTIREDKNKPVKPPMDMTRSKAILYTEKVRSIPVATLSVPLRPSSRTIPRAVDARFQGRNVYTMVIPIENLPAYSGDWIVWFAERQQVPGATPLMRAPLPFRKMEPADLTSSGKGGTERVQISAILEKDGRLGKIAVLTKAGPMAEQAVIQDLESWEFKPATRDGVPIDVEVVMEVTFNLSAAVAKSVQP